jgi:hypothetical protein
LFDQGQRIEHGMRRGPGRVAAGLFDVATVVFHETTVATTTGSPEARKWFCDNNFAFLRQRDQ